MTKVTPIRSEQTDPNKGPRQIRFRALLVATTDTLGMKGVAGNVLLGLDDYGAPWALLTGPEGGVAGWARVYDREAVLAPKSNIITGTEVQATLDELRKP